MVLFWGLLNYSLSFKLHMWLKQSFMCPSAGIPPVKRGDMSDFYWLDWVRHACSSTEASSVCCFSFSRTCGSLIPVTFPGFPASPSIIQKNRKLNLSSAWMHRSSTLNSVSWGNLHEDFVQLSFSLAIWASRMVGPTGVTALLLSVYRSTLQAKQVFGLQGHPRRRPGCQLLSDLLNH